MLRYALIPDWLWSKRETHHITLSDFLEVGSQGKLSRILCQADCNFYKVLNTQHAVAQGTIAAQDFLEMSGYDHLCSPASLVSHGTPASKATRPLVMAGLSRQWSIQDWPSLEDFNRHYVERCYHFLTHEDSANSIHIINPLFSQPIKGYTWECKGIVDNTAIMVAVAISDEIFEELNYVFPEVSAVQQIQRYKIYRYIKLVEHILQAMNDTTHMSINNHPLLAVYIDTLAYGRAKVLQRLEEVFRVVDPSVLPEYTS